MKYLYGDSTEFPLQRDFLGLLENFIDTSVKVITIENTILELKEDIRNKRKLRDSVLEEMDGFIAVVENAISKALSLSKQQDIIFGYTEKSKHFIEKFINEVKKEFSDNISKEIKQLEEKIKVANDEIKKTLKYFFILDPLPIINKRYTLKITKEGYSAEVKVEYGGDISCIFEIETSELPFWNRHVKGFDFLKGVEIPAKMKKPLFRNDLQPHIISLDYYYLTHLTLSNRKLEVVFRRTPNIDAERFRLRIGSVHNEIYYAEEDGVEKSIKAVPELKRELNISKLQELGEIIVKQAQLLYQKKQLKVVYLSGRDVLANNLYSELMQKIAEIFAPTIKEIKKHTPSREVS